jgi:two-component system, response regulator
LRQIKTAPSLKRLPVVILTSSQEDSDLIKSYDGGANSYLVKPISSIDFLEVVHQIDRYWLALNVGPPLSDLGQ